MLAANATSVRTFDAIRARIFGIANIRTKQSVEKLMALMKLESAPRGARIVVTLEDGRRVRREVQVGSGYLSMNPKQQHFGVGKSRLVDVQIIWPNGERQSLADLAANASYTVRQGVGVVEPMPLREISRSTP